MDAFSEVIELLLLLMLLFLLMLLLSLMLSVVGVESVVWVVLVLGRDPVMNSVICLRVWSIFSCSGLICGVWGSFLLSSDRILICLMESMLRLVLRFMLRSSMFLG